MSERLNFLRVSQWFLCYSRSGFDSIKRELFPMGKDTIITRAPKLPKVPPRTEPPVRTMSMDKAKRLIRKTSDEHAGLFRRLAK